MERITASGTGRWRQGKRLSRGLIGGLLAGAWALGTPGCGPPTENVLADANGNSIRLTAIARITADEELTDSEKRERLRELGIQDEALIELLMAQPGEPAPF